MNNVININKNVYHACLESLALLVLVLALPSDQSSALLNLRLSVQRVRSSLVTLQRHLLLGLDLFELDHSKHHNDETPHLSLEISTIALSALDLLFSEAVSCCAGSAEQRRPL